MISSGNDTIGSMYDYIRQVSPSYPFASFTERTQVEYDKQLQESFDQQHARESVGKAIGNILLSLLAFLPGVGEISDIVVGGVDTFAIINKVRVRSIRGTGYN